MFSGSVEVRRAAARELSEHAARVPESALVVSRMLELLQAPGNPAHRGHLDPGHFTASAFVVCPERRRLLLVHHARLERWLQPGGHLEQEDVSFRAAAEREVREETGVADLEPLQLGIFDVDVHAIPASSREGAHAHFDVRHAFRARSAELRVAAEVRAARWIPLSAVTELNAEESIARCVRRLGALLGTAG